MKYKESIKEFYDISKDIGRVSLIGVVAFGIIVTIIFLIGRIFTYVHTHKKGVVIATHQIFQILLFLVILHIVFAISAYLRSMVKIGISNRNK